MGMSVGRSASRFTVRPLTASRWPDVEDLFGPGKGANSGCWCMWPRLTGAEFRALSKDRRKKAFRSCVAKGPAPGLLLYEDGRAVGWVAVSPRSAVVRFGKARASALEPGSDPLTHYAITCFYVRAGYRRRGLMAELARAAIDHAKRKKARAIDACPIETDRPLMWGEGFVGIATVFRGLGFTEVARRSPRRPLMRLSLGD